MKISEEVRKVLASMGLNTDPMKGFKKQMRKLMPNVYVPGGERRNVRGTFVKNKKIAAQMNDMHVKWYVNKFGKFPSFKAE